MASLGNIFVAGSECMQGKYPCGISYLLSSKSPCSYIYKIDNGRWHVEFVEGSRDVVARTTTKVSLDNLQSSGFAAIQEALDVLSIKGVFSAYLSDPAKSYTGIYYADGQLILRVYSLFDFTVGMHMEVKQLDKSGSEIPQPALPELIWNESFRYYRLSQTSVDHFEAYRNLFLGFEALLNSICPKNGSEGEGAWLRRSLKAVAGSTVLAVFTPTGNEDPVDYIITSQYKNVRCKLQHAKFPNAALPHSSPSHADVKQAYEDLICIWRQIASAYFNVPAGGGIITYAGFAAMLGNQFNSGATIYYTPDTSLPHSSDISPNPGGSVVYEFISTTYQGQIRPGVVRVIAEEDVAESSNKYAQPIHRICSGHNAALFGVSYIESGLVVSGVDRWESVHDIRLINATQPKTEFAT